MQEKPDSKTRRNLRILYITSKRDTIRELFGELTRFAYDVTVIGLIEDSSILSYSSINGRKRLSRYRFLQISDRKTMARYIAMLTGFLVILGQLIFSRAIVSDIAICSNSANTLLAVPFRRLGSIRRLVCNVGDYFPIDNAQNSFEQTLTLIRSTMDRVAWKAADSTWCLTFALRRRVSQLFQTTKHSIKVVPPLYFPISEPPVPALKPFMVYIGSIRPDAGLEIVLEALAKLPTSISRPTFKLFGIPIDDKVLSRIEECAQRLNVREQLIIKGFVPPKELENELRGALCGFAIFSGGLLNYSNYAYPSKVKSYLEHGIVPVIGSSSALVDDPELNKYCFFVEETPEDIERVISFLLGNQDIVKQMGRAAYYYTKKEHESPSFLNAVEALLRK